MDEWFTNTKHCDEREIRFRMNGHHNCQSMATSLLSQWLRNNNTPHTEHTHFVCRYDDNVRIMVPITGILTKEHITPHMFHKTISQNKSSVITEKKITQYSNITNASYCQHRIFSVKLVGADEIQLTSYTPPHNSNATYFIRNRTSYQLSSHVRLDLSYVWMHDGNNSYQVELEVTSKHASYHDIIKPYHDVISILSSPYIVYKIHTMNIRKIDSWNKHTKIDPSQQLIQSTVVKPIPLEGETCSHLYKRDAYVSSFKADGTRSIIIAFRSYGVVTCFTSNNIETYHYDKKGKSYEPGIYDAEYDDSTNTYRIMDCIMPISRYPIQFQKSYEKRIAICRTMISETMISSLILKSPCFAPSLSEQLSILDQSIISYETDGIIFTPRWSDYYGNAPILKWKPEYLLTIDLKVTFVKWHEDNTRLNISLAGPHIEPPSLHNRISRFNKEYHDISIFHPDVLCDLKNLGNDLKPGTIVECSYHDELETYIPIRIRNDKHQPNHWNVIFSNIDSRKSFISLSDIISQNTKSSSSSSTYTSSIQNIVSYVYCMLPKINNTMMIGFTYHDIVSNVQPNSHVTYVIRDMLSTSHEKIQVSHAMKNISSSIETYPTSCMPYHYWPTHNKYNFILWYDDTWNVNTATALYSHLDNGGYMCYVPPESSDRPLKRIVHDIRINMPWCLVIDADYRVGKEFVIIKHIRPNDTIPILQLCDMVPKYLGNMISGLHHKYYGNIFDMLCDIVVPQNDKDMQVFDMNPNTLDSKNLEKMIASLCQKYNVDVYIFKNKRRSQTYSYGGGSSRKICIFKWFCQYDESVRFVPLLCGIDSSIFWNI